jgi:hypothetical protein
MPESPRTKFRPKRAVRVPGEEALPGTKTSRPKVDAEVPLGRWNDSSRSGRIVRFGQDRLPMVSVGGIRARNRRVEVRWRKGRGKWRTTTRWLLDVEAFCRRQAARGGRSFAFRLDEDHPWHPVRVENQDR